MGISACTDTDEKVGNFVPLTSSKVLSFEKIERKTLFSFVFCSLIRTFAGDLANKSAAAMVEW